MEGERRGSTTNMDDDDDVSRTETVRIGLTLPLPYIDTYTYISLGFYRAPIPCACFFGCGRVRVDVVHCF